jgi:SlyX protein
MSNESGNPETRIVELESRLAFLDQTVEALHEVVFRQQGQLDGLTAELASLRRRLRELDPAATAGGAGHD